MQFTKPILSTLAGIGLFLATPIVHAQAFNPVPPNPAYFGISNDAVANAAWQRVDDRAKERDQDAQNAQRQGRDPATDSQTQQDNRDVGEAATAFVGYMNSIGH